MIVVVMATKRNSPIPSPLVGALDLDCRTSVRLDGDELDESDLFAGRHFRTASTEALQGCTWRGYENITRTTIAAFPIVELSEGASIGFISFRAENG